VLRARSGGGGKRTASCPQVSAGTGAADGQKLDEILKACPHSTTPIDYQLIIS